MKNQNYNSRYMRTLANDLAASSNKHFKAAREAERHYQWLNDKVQKVRDFLISSPWLLFTVIYFILLFIDAWIMKPIVALIVQDGMKMSGEWTTWLFVAIYVLLVAALTIGVAYGVAKLFDGKLRELQIELAMISRPGVARSIIADEIKIDEAKDLKWGIVCGVILFSLLIGMALYRNYLVNDFQIKFNSPDDWVNLLLPIAVATALCFFGLYKDTVFRLWRFKTDRDEQKAIRDSNQQRADDIAKQAIEQEYEARKNLEEITHSAELVELIKRYETQSVISETFYDEVKTVSVQLRQKSAPVAGIQVIGFTGDDSAIYKTTDIDGIALLEWSTDSDHVRTIKIGGYGLPGTRWMDGSTVSVDVDEFILSHTQNGKNGNAFAKRLSPPVNGQAV